MLRTVKTETGLVRGTPAADPRITAFKGIPFAAPPVGNLRWKAPQPAASWEGVKDCIEFAPISVQNIPGLNKDDIYTREWNVDPEIPMNEDCLYLNVWTPAKSADEKLPVYVWYFGGGLQVGNPAEMEFDGERLARRGIVVVSVNYRVNVFGFLAHPELTAEAPEAPANFGHLDQQAGLLWTKRNIAAFGGDPDRITIGGQSAGGMSVLAQLNCPANEGSIQGAIVESGIFMGFYQPRVLETLADAEKRGEDFFAFLGVKNLEEARALSAEYIRDKNNEYQGRWGNVTDGVFQPANYMDSLRSGKLLDVPLMMGYTDDEFFAVPEAESEESLRELAQRQFGERAEEFLSLIKAEEGLEAAKENARVSTIKNAVHAAFRMMEKNGMTSPRYFYAFGPEIPGWDHPGAFHSSDLWFFFETLAKCWRPFTGKHYDLARQMCNYWVNFVKTGNPNGEDADGSSMEAWAPYQLEEPICMGFRDMPKAEVSETSPLEELLIESQMK